MTKNELISIAQTANVTVFKSWTNTQIKETILKAIRNKIKRAVDAIDNHERYRGVYFWTPPANASSRRQMEERAQYEEQITFKNRVYSYKCEVTCSCKNVYYEGAFKLNETYKNVRLFKGLINELTELERKVTA